MRSPAKILLVDDHRANLLALEAILAPLGQTLVCASSGDDALRAVLREDFALILLDVEMPGLDGLRTAAVLKERPRTRTTPIIFLTAVQRDRRFVHEGYERGAVDYLTKPFDPHILRSKVQVFLELHHARAELVAHQEALRAREREERTRGLVDAIPLAVWTTRGDGVIAYANRTFREFAGESADLGSILALLHPTERARIATERAAAFHAGVDFEMTMRLRHRDGHFRWFLVRSVASFGDPGEDAAWIETATDIDDLRRAADARDVFLATASHELRTPLATAKALAQLAVAREGTEHETRQSLTEIARQVDRMARLVEDLLEASRIQLGRVALARRPFDLAALVRDACGSLSTLSERHPIAVRAPSRLDVVADRDRIEQVVGNLVTNAVRYSPDGGPIDVTLEEAGDEVELSVRDRGLGVPAERLEEVFESFAHAHGSSYGGLGLGLTITRGIVQAHGGRVWVESTGRPGEGSVFRLRLPRGG